MVRLLKSKNATFHSVSIGSSFESGVLQALASVGGGSVRQIDGEQTAQRTALELLNEMMQPGLTDLQIEFRGIEVAAVYPQTPAQSRRWYAANHRWTLPADW